MRISRLLELRVLPVFTVGFGSLALSAWLWSRTVEIRGGLVCGTVNGLWRGYWSPPSGPGTTKECLEQAAWLLRFAHATLLGGIVALLLATLVLTWRTWRRRLGPRAPSGTALAAHIGAALAWSAVAAAVAVALAIYLDPGPTCPWIRPGELDDYLRMTSELEKDGSGLAQCTAAGGGWTPDTYPGFAILGALGAAVAYPVTYLLVRWRTVSARRRPESVAG